MEEAMEKMQETVEEHSHGADPWARRVALLVSLLAAALALAEIGGKAAQNASISHNITASDAWAYYQARNARAVIRASEASILASLPNAKDPEIQARIKEAQEYSARQRDDPKGGEGAKQLAAKAKAEEVERDESGHRYHKYEYLVGALEIAIVLASVSVVTRMRQLAVGAAAIGLAAALAAIGVATDLF